MWVPGAGGTLIVIDLPAPSDDDVAELARRVCRKMTTVVDRWQEARGEAEPREHADELTSLVMADFGAAAPRIDEEPTEKRPGRLAAMFDGYSLEGRPNVAPHDRPGLARLLRYGTRPALAQERLSLENGRVVYKLPKPFWTGQTHVILEPVEFLRRIASLILPARSHSIRYHGLFSAAAKDCARACALVPPVDSADDAVEGRSAPRCDQGPDRDSAASTITKAMPITSGGSAHADDRDEPYRNRRRIEWARLLRQVFAVDVLWCPCGGQRKIINWGSSNSVVVQSGATATSRGGGHLVFLENGGRYAGTGSGGNLIFVARGGTADIDFGGGDQSVFAKAGSTVSCSDVGGGNNTLYYQPGANLDGNCASRVRIVSQPVTDTFSRCTPTTATNQVYPSPHFSLSRSGQVVTASNQTTGTLTDVSWKVIALNIDWWHFPDAVLAESKVAAGFTWTIPSDLETRYPASAGWTVYVFLNGTDPFGRSGGRAGQKIPEN